jgi:hypothetical protein
MEFKDVDNKANAWRHESFDQLDELDIPVCTVLEMEPISPWEAIQILAQ